jgi:hypothetical protein
MNQDKKTIKAVGIIGSSPSPLKKLIQQLQETHSEPLLSEDHSYIELTSFSGEGKSKIVLDTEQTIEYNEYITKNLKPNRAERRKKK